MLKFRKPLLQVWCAKKLLNYALLKHQLEGAHVTVDSFIVCGSVTF